MATPARFRRTADLQHSRPTYMYVSRPLRVLMEFQPNILGFWSRYAPPGIARLFNVSLSSSRVPSEWEAAIVHLILKIISLVSTSNYRPISVVPILSRTIERPNNLHRLKIISNNSVLCVTKKKHTL